MLRPFWICRRHRRSATCVAFVAVLYILSFNIIAFYSLTSFQIARRSQLIKHGIPRSDLRLTFISRNVSCKRLILSQKALPVSALASFPGSGNTWIRHILQQATGLITGSVYADLSLKNGGFPGEGLVSGSVLVVKTHEWGKKERQKYERAVLIIRNPYDALLSEFNRKYGGHGGHATKQHFRLEWKNYVHKMSDDWVKMNYDWLQFHKQLHITRYENFRRNPKAELISLLHFFNITISNEDIICAMNNLDGKFKRRKTKILRYDPYTSVMRMKIDADISFVETEIERLGQLSTSGDG